MADLVGCAVLGLGNMGWRHAEAIASQVPGARLVAVSEPVPERLAQARATFGVRGYADWQEVLADPAVDAVLVVTPSSLHAEVCTAAAAAGKHIFCEKPLALTVAECEAIDAAVQRAGVLFQLGFMRRFDPGYAAAKRAIEAGAIGEVRAYMGINRDPAPPPPEYVARSGGIYLDSLIHDFDVARFLVGDEVERVFALGKVLMHPWMRELHDVDHAHVLLEFRGGALGHIEGSRNGIYGYDIRAEVMGTRGTIRIGYDRQTPITIQTAAGIQTDFVPGYLERFSTAYVEELRAFIRSVQAGTPPGVGTRDGRQSLLIALAAARSQSLGRPVAVEPSPEDP